MKLLLRPVCPKTWDNYRQLRIDSRTVFYNQSLQKINNTKVAGPALQLALME